MNLYTFRQVAPVIAAPLSVLVLGLLMWLLLPNDRVGGISLFAAVRVINILPELICLVGIVWTLYTVFRVASGRLSKLQFCSRCGGDLDHIKTPRISFSVCRACGTTYR